MSDEERSETQSELQKPAAQVSERFVPHIGIRLGVAAGLLLLLIGIAVFVFVFGMLMFSFSGDAGHGKQMPRWLELGMLLGWPFTLFLGAVVPPILLAFWPRLRFMIPGIILSLMLPVVWFFVGWITLLVIVTGD